MFEFGNIERPSTTLELLEMTLLKQRIDYLQTRHKPNKKYTYSVIEAINSTVNDENFRSTYDKLQSEWMYKESKESQ